MEFLEGGLASVVAGCSTHPLDLIKVRLQVQGEGIRGSGGGRIGILSMGTQIVKEGGVKALFSGVSATLVRQMTYSTTRMGLYEMMKKRMERPNQEIPLYQKAAAGLVAGGIGAAVGNPADMAMVRMQADGAAKAGARRGYTSVADAIARAVREEGVGALWRGCGPTVVRAMLVTSSQLATYDHVKATVMVGDRSMLKLPDGLLAHVGASSVAGVVAGLASNPVDVVKTRLMNMHVPPPPSPPPYLGPLHCAIQTVRVEGPLALYKGLLPTIFRQAPFTIVLFVTLERVRSLLRRDH